MIQIKNLKFIVCLLLALCMHTLNAQYITIKGKQFYDKSGNPFYPVICNYQATFICNTCGCPVGGHGNVVGLDCTGLLAGTTNYTTDYDIAPKYNTGSQLNYTSKFPWGHGLDYIKGDFQKIKSMGFNTVRVMELGAAINDTYNNGPTSTYDPPGARFPCNSYASPSTDFFPGLGTFWGKNPIMIAPPYDNTNTQNENFTYIIIPLLQNLLNVANEVGINVIYDVGGSNISASADNDPTVYDEAGEVQANIYSDYLSALASNLQGYPALMAYELYNEPGDAGSTRVAQAKNKICVYSAQWYDAIKAQDANHLITMGDFTPGVDVFTYDPTILKLDFNTFHPYPFYYWTPVDGFNLQNAINRMAADLAWCNNVTPMPWLIGETGAPAFASTKPQLGQNGNTTLMSGLPDPTYCTNPADIGVDVSSPPFVYGTFDDQTNYCQQSQQLVINSGGSGYGWWYFHQGTWPIGYSQVDNYNAATGGMGIFEALVNAVDATYDGTNYVYSTGTSTDKPLVADAFSSNTITHGTEQIALPDNYYNPYGGTYFAWSGTVVDQDGVPIKDAVIQGSNTKNHSGDNLHPSSGADLPKVPANAGFSIITFSKADGSFSLVAPVQSPPSVLTSAPYNDYDYGKFDHIAISAPGASVFSWNVDDLSQSGEPSTTTITLNRRPGVFDNPVFELDVNSSNSTSTSSPYIVTARHALITGADVVETTGLADFHASSMVDVWGATGLSAPGLAAEEGSYTHIYCLPVDFDCSQLLSPDYIHRNPTLIPQNNDSVSVEEEKDISVNYLLPANTIRLMPNPAENHFYLLAPGDSPIGVVEINDALGNNIYAGKIHMDGQTPFNTSTFAPGFYNVHVINNANNQNFKLIICR